MKRKDIQYGFILFALVLFILDFVVEKVNGRFWLNDFKVYYSAAEAALHSEEIYGIHFGLDTGYYKYSPFVLLLFIPYCIFSFSIASIIHFVIIAFSTIAAIVIIQNIISTYLFGNNIKKKNLLLSLGFMCILIHLVRELHLGNVNMIILFILSFALWLILRSKFWYAGFCIGLAMLVKPFFLILLLPLLLHRKYKTILGVFAMAGFSIIIPAAVFGIANNIVLHNEWIHAMLAHSSYLKSNHTIQSLLEFYIYSGLPNITLYLIGGVSLLFLATFWTGPFKMTSFQDDNKRLIIDYFVFIALIPNLVITDTEHFLLTLPLIMIILNYLFTERNYGILITFIAVIFFYAGNSTDLLGHKLAGRFDDMGTLGLSNLGVIGILLYVYFKTLRKS